MLAGGITLVALAPVAGLTALVALAEKSSCQSDRSTYSSSSGSYSSSYGADCTGYDNTITGSLIVGTVLLAAGIPLLVYGAQRVPEPDTTAFYITPSITRDRGGLNFVARF